ncbi:MAG: DNA-3-methyladenine glycosylase I [Myxococcales bacterium]|nr:DNA-3-methyladenine glycosylase I [Myxococcales bacterium]
MTAREPAHSGCPWPQGDPQMVAYHDTQWGVPVHDDRTLFEFLVLESAQAGLSWRTVLHKRAGYRRLFADFDPVAVAAFTAADIERLLLDPAIVRNRAKVNAAVNNARRFLNIQTEFGSFAAYQWQWTQGRTLQRAHRRIETVEPRSLEGDAWAADLKRRGFQFLGPTVVHAHMQATGMVNDHLVGCVRWRELGGAAPEA